MNLQANLEQKRFVVKEEGELEKLKAMREMIAKLKDEYPYLCGLGFFGSRVKGLSRPDSDYDVCIFYNSDNMSEESGRPNEWRDVVTRLEKAAASHLDYRVNLSPGEGGLRVNLSKGATTSDLRVFTSEVKNSLTRCNRDLSAVVDEISRIPPTRNLLSQFFLCVGDEVYENRQYILNYFGEDEENGNLYLNILMRCLSKFEKSKNNTTSFSSQYQDFPKTINEAEKYFIT